MKMDISSSWGGQMISLTPVGELVSGRGRIIWIFILAGSRLLGWPRGWVSNLR